MALKKLHQAILAIIILSLTTLLSIHTTSVNEYEQTKLREIERRNKLIVGTIIDFPPMQFYEEDGDFVGFEVDLAKEIAEGLEVELEFLIIDWEDLFNAVQSGRIDLGIASTTITSERSEKVKFSVPYFNAGQTIVTLKGNEEIQWIDDLKGKKVGVESKTTGENALIEREINYISYHDHREETFVSKSLEELFSENIDAIVLDSIGALNLVKENSSLKIAGIPFTQEHYGVVGGLESELLMEKVDLIILDLKESGRLEELQNKWLNSPIDQVR